MWVGVGGFCVQEFFGGADFDEMRFVDILTHKLLHQASKLETGVGWYHTCGVVPEGGVSKGVCFWLKVPFLCCHTAQGGCGSVFGPGFRQSLGLFLE